VELIETVGKTYEEKLEKNAILYQQKLSMAQIIQQGPVVVRFKLVKIIKKNFRKKMLLNQLYRNW
jgi:hypothetical protein